MKAGFECYRKAKAVRQASFEAAVAEQTARDAEEDARTTPAAKLKAGMAQVEKASAAIKDFMRDKEIKFSAGLWALEDTKEHKKNNRAIFTVRSAVVDFIIFLFFPFIFFFLITYSITFPFPSQQKRLLLRL